MTKVSHNQSIYFPC